MLTIVEELSDETDWVAAVLSHMTRNKQRWSLVKLAAREGGFTHARAKDVLGLTAGGLKGHLDALVDAFILGADRAGYSLTPWGDFGYRLLVRSGSRSLSDLRGAQLVLVNRPSEIDPRILLALLEPAAASLIGVSGPYRYIAVCDADPDLVDDLTFAIHRLGAETVELTVTKVT